MINIPSEIKKLIQQLKQAGYQAYVVGGCLRDLLLGRTPKDWDIATSARPGQIQILFKKSFYSNKFFTVTVQTNSSAPALKEIEITTFRKEARYTDKRHPDEIKFADCLADDLSRRDFTINAMALDVLDSKNKKKTGSNSQAYNLIDPFLGRSDLKKGIIRTVGPAKQRFNEDALRMMRAVRLAAALGFEIEKKTFEAIKANAFWLPRISSERIRDELIKIIMSDRAAQGIDRLRQAGLLQSIIPELVKGYQVEQNKHHIYDCYQHNLKSLEYAAKRNFNMHVRLAALLHDVAKPFCKKGRGENATFYGHEIKGAKMADRILTRLKFSKKDAEKIVRLVRYHLFYYNTDEVSASSVRRLVRKVGPENMKDLLELRMADRIGSGVPKAEPYKLRHLKYVIEKVSHDPISAKMLKVGGQDVMDILKIKPGPKVGQILNVLLGYVLLDPEKNKKNILQKEIKRLGSLSDRELFSLSQQAVKDRDNIETKRDKMTRQKYWVT